MNISRREKILLTATLYLVFIFLFYKLFYDPLTQQLNVLKQENINLSQEKSDLQHINQEKKQRQAEIQKLLAENQRMEQKIPKDKEIVALLDELQRAADKSGVNLVSVEYKKGADHQEETVKTSNPDPQNAVHQAQVDLTAASPARKPMIMASSPKTNQVWILSLSLNVAGRYYQLQNFLLQVEKARRIISVQSCSLMTETKQTATDNASGAASVSTKSQDPPPPPPIAKGERNAGQDQNNTDTSAFQSNSPAEKALERYDMSKMQMKLQINTYYCP